MVDECVYQCVSCNEGHQFHLGCCSYVRHSAVTSCCKKELLSKKEKATAELRRAKLTGGTHRGDCGVCVVQSDLMLVDSDCEDHHSLGLRKHYRLRIEMIVLGSQRIILDEYSGLFLYVVEAFIDLLIFNYL